MFSRPARTFLAGLALATSLSALMVLAGGVGSASPQVGSTAAGVSAVVNAEDDESAGVILLCTEPSTVTTGGRPTALTSSDFSGVIQNADDLLRQKHPDEAKELYQSVLGAEAADAQARTCAAAGLAKIAIDAPDAPSNPIADQSKNVSSFGSSYLTPLWNLLLPFAIIVVILLLIAKLATRFLVNADVKVTENPTWLYVCCGWIPILLGAALLLLAPPDGIGWWLLLPGAAIILLNAIYLWKINDAARPTTLVLVFAGGVLIVPLIMIVFGLAMAGTLAMGIAAAGFGIVAIGHSRGLRKELSIEGMKEDGTPDAGISQLMQVALSDMSVTFPRGAMMPVSTDVSSLQQEALAILPEGMWAKIGAFLVSLTRPPRPWRVLVTCVDEVTIEVVLTRNGRFADAVTIRSADFGWPAPGGSSEDAEKDSGAVAPADLTRAAAAFVLLALSARHPDLERGLNGATSWAGVAAQVIATSERPKPLTADQREQLLANAVALDHGNLSAQLAFIVERFARTAEQNGTFQTELEKLQPRLEPEEGTSPGDMAALRLRLGFNLLVAYTNTWLVAEGPKNRDNALERARTASDALIALIDTCTPAASPRKDLQPLAGEIRRSAEVLRSILIDGAALNEEVRGVLSMYEIACAHAFKAESTPTSWPVALDWLERATLADPSYAEWARSDPSFKGLTVGFAATDWSNDPSPQPAPAVGPPLAKYLSLQRFREIVGDALPKSFTALDDINPYSRDLALRGITSAAGLAQRSARWIADELGLSRAVTRRWVELAELHERLPKDRRSVLVLLVMSGVESVGSLEQYIGDDTKRSDLAVALIAAAAGGDIVPPSEDALFDLANWSAGGVRSPNPAIGRHSRVPAVGNRPEQ